MLDDHRQRQRGHQGQNGSLTADGSMVGASPIAPALSIAGPASATPQLLSLKLTPQADPATLPANTSLLVTPGGHISLTATAADSGGNDVFINWTCNSGTFSNPGEVRMTWDTAAQVWTSTWQWQCPPNRPDRDHANSLGCKESRSFGIPLARLSRSHSQTAPHTSTGGSSHA